MRDLLFDLRADPGERSNRLESEAAPPATEILERLRSLGYVGD